MRTILYILSRDIAQRRSLSDIIFRRFREDSVSVLLIQEAVRLQEIPGNHVFVLDEDAALRRVESPFTKVSYLDTLDLVFGADMVVVF